MRIFGKEYDSISPNRGLNFAILFTFADGILLSCGVIAFVHFVFGPKHDLILGLPALLPGLFGLWMAYQQTYQAVWNMLAANSNQKSPS
jgi:hypothetical protein